MTSIPADGNLLSNLQTCQEWRSPQPPETLIPVFDGLSGRKWLLVPQAGPQRGRSCACFLLTKSSGGLTSFPQHSLDVKVPRRLLLSQIKTHMFFLERIVLSLSLRWSWIPAVPVILGQGSDGLGHLCCNFQTPSSGLAVAQLT